jgi:hypothetical protein
MMPNMAMALGDGEPAAGPWHVVPVGRLVRMLRPCEDAPAGRPWILAGGGRSGSGKTTLAERIRGAVPASTVVHTDDVAWNQAMFDWTDFLVGGGLDPVHRREPVSFRPPAWCERNREGAIEVPLGGELVIVEGVGAARHELMHLVDAVERQEVIAASIHEYDHTGACSLSRAATSTDRLRESDHGVIMTWWNLR